MSVKQTKPRKRLVESARMTEYGVSKPMLAAFAVTSATKYLDSITRNVLKDVSRALPLDALSIIRPFIHIRPEYWRLRQRAVLIENLLELPEIEIAKIIALAPMMAASIRTVRQEKLDECLRLLCESATLSEVQQSEQLLMAHLEAEHQQVLIKQVKQTSVTAALKVGFTIIATPPRPCSTSFSVVARDQYGRALLIEINANRDGSCGLETKVVSEDESRGEQVLNGFDQALEALGVRVEKENLSLTGNMGKLAKSIAALLLLLD